MVFRLVLLIIASASVIGAISNGVAADQSGAGETINRCIVCHADWGSVHVMDTQLQWGNCVVCHRGNQHTSRQDIAHHFLIGKEYAWYRLPQSSVVQAGQKLIKLFACRRCHVQQREGNQTATNLDQLLAVTSVEKLTAALRTPAFYMPDFHLNKGDRALLVTRILAGGVGVAKTQELSPLTVHFADKVDDENVFEKHCGKCHRLLTAARGGLGSGEIGPNLSGLLTKFYPLSYKNQQSWTMAVLKDWLHNPRKVRPLTRMPPVQASAEEVDQLIKELSIVTTE